MRTLSLVVLTHVLQAVAVQAQEARLIASDRPTIELPYEFTSIARIFELRDRRVVVLDRLEADVRLADLRTGTTSVLGRIGDGPGEYRAPLTLIPLGGDSVGVFDDANVRILVINGTGSVGGFVSPFSMAEGTRIGGTAGDGRGRLYAEQRATSASDSVTIFRWRIGSQAADRVVRMHRPLVRGASALGNGAVRPWSHAQPSTANVWSVGLDGTVVLVHWDPYHVVRTSAAGVSSVGTTIPYQVVAVNDSIKRAFVEALPTRRSGMVVDGRSGRSTAIQSRPESVDPSSLNWAREVPPFRGDAFIAVAPNGVLWIQRTTFGREGARYDLIGPDGNLVDRVRLPDGHRVIGFGRDAMYVVRRNEDDIEFLQRRPLPR